MSVEKSPTGLKIDALKEMHLETALVVDGEARGKIAVGRDGSHGRLAERIAERIELYGMNGIRGSSTDRLSPLRISIGSVLGEEAVFIAFGGQG